MILLGSLNTSLIRHSGNGENRALGRLGDSLVGGVYADSESGGNILAVDLLHVLQPLSEASEQNGGDNARVASGASEHRFRGNFRNLARVGSVVFLERLGSSHYGHGHIGTCIAVGHISPLIIITARPF